jgi:hypothetical protein
MRLKRIVFIGFIILSLWDFYNIFFRYSYNFNAVDFGDPISINADTEFPLRSTLHVEGNFKCPVYIKHGFDIDKVKYSYELVGQVDTVIYSEFYGGKYMFEFEGESCVKELDKLNFQVYNLDFTLLKIFFGSPLSKGSL